jgi:hypothetical protein
MGRVRVISILRGRVPGWSLDGSGGSGSGGSGGYGYGDGSGDGSGSGGYGSGGYGSGSRSGGYGYGYGDGDGSGSGYGYGYGDGDGDGSGYGYGYGYGDGGYGYGDGSGSDVERARPVAAIVTVSQLRERAACSEAVRLFRRTFPHGAEFPRDIVKARVAGLDLEWAREHLGLILPRTEDIELLSWLTVPSATRRARGRRPLRKH